MRRLLLFALFLPGLALGQTTAITTTDTVQSGCVLGAANATCQVTLKGKTTVGFIVTAISSPTGITLVNESSRDGTNWDIHPFLDMDNGGTITSVPNASLAVGFSKTMVVGGGMGFARVRVSAWTSGSATVMVRATDTSADVSWVDKGAVATTVQPPSVSQTGGWVTTAAPSYSTTTLNALSLTTAGNLRTQDLGTAATAAAVPANALFVAGGVTTSAPSYSTGNLGALSLDTAGNLRVAQPVTGNPCLNPNATLLWVAGSTSGTSAVQIIALSGSNRIYICSLNVTGVSGTTPAFGLVYGTGSNCATGQTTVQGAFTTTAAALYSFHGPGPITAAGTALCYLNTGTTPVQRYSITYVQAP
jgi:hypothetical protein